MNTVYCRFHLSGVFVIFYYFKENFLVTFVNKAKNFAIVNFFFSSFFSTVFLEELAKVILKLLSNCYFTGL